MRAVAMAVAAAVSIVLVAALAVVTAAVAADAAGAVPQYRLCAQEDGVRCVWRANVQGNGEGRSFVAGNHEGARTYVSHRIARKVARHDDWRRVPDRLVGETADLVGGHRSKVITANTVWSVGPTTLFIWPYRGRVGTS